MGRDQDPTELGVPGAEDFLREARLRFCLQLVNHGTPHLWTLLQMEQQWIAKLVADFEWLRELAPEAELPQMNAETWDHIVAYIGESAGRWKALIRKVVKRHVASLERKHQWNRWHQDVLEELREQGVCFSERHTNDLEHFCAKCKMRFTSVAAQTVHAFKKHGRLCEVRHFVLGKQCEACLRHYSTHINLINHVKRKRLCKQFYLTRGQIVEVQAGVNSRGASAKLTEWHDPYLQAEGPHECRAQSVQSLVHPQQAEYDALYDAWSAAADLACETTTDILESLRLATAGTVLLPKEVIEHFGRWLEDWAGNHEEVDLATLQQLASYRVQFCADWILDGVLQSAAAREKAGEIFEREADGMDVLVRPAAALPDFEVHVIAHLFSGHRRSEDLQSILEQKGFKPLSIDIIFDKVKGNLLRHETFQFFRRALYAGWLKGFVAGPPCETWSKARAVAVEGGRHPRVVRTRTCPQGRLDMTFREHQQVALGSGLLGVALRLVAISICSGSVAVLEHPEQDERNEQAASIWRLPIVRTFHRFSNCSSCCLLQGHYGGKTPKPTRLLFTNVTAQIEEIIVRGRCSALPKRTAVGRKCDGSWATTELKEYPGGLCKMLGEVFEKSLPAVGNKVMPPEFWEFVHELMAEFDFAASQGQDFNPATAMNLN